MKSQKQKQSSRKFLLTRSERHVQIADALQHLENKLKETLRLAQESVPLEQLLKLITSDLNVAIGFIQGLKEGLIYGSGMTTKPRSNLESKRKQ